MPNYKDNVNTSTSQGGRYAVAGFDPLNHKVSLPFGKTNLTGRGSRGGTSSRGTTTTKRRVLKGKGNLVVPSPALVASLSKLGTASRGTKGLNLNIPTGWNKIIPVISHPNASSFGLAKFK